MPAFIDSYILTGLSTSLNSFGVRIVLPFRKHLLQMTCPQVDRASLLLAEGVAKQLLQQIQLVAIRDLQ